MSDPYADQVFLLLHCENSLADTSPIPKFLYSKYPPTFSSVHKQWGSFSFANAPSSADGLLCKYYVQHLFNDQPFTIETWMKLSSTSFWYEYDAGTILSYAVVGASSSTTSNFAIYWGISSTGVLSFQCYIGSSTLITLNYSALTPTQWTERFRALAVTWDGTTLRMFVDGVVVASTSTSGSFYDISASGAPLGIGAGYASVSQIESPRLALKAYLDEFRITGGVARYTENYTPATAPFDDPEPLIFPVHSPLRFLRADQQDCGVYQITGTVDELGVAGAYRVRLFDRISARCIRETWSDASGAYAFQNIAYRYRGYFVIAYDHGDNPHNAAIADLMTPEAMP